jgi:4'-phosphopantetheinyl transferase
MNIFDLLPGQTEVHVWPVRLTASAAINCAYRTLLSNEETAQADRFAFEHLRRSYELSQGALRLLLGHYLECRPRDVEFTFGHRGKPAVRDYSRIRFNMAHSRGLALYAFTADCEVGVDVEQVRSIPEIEQIASYYFCRSEASDVLSIHDTAARQEAFFRCWTRKEAYIKAVGDGLHLPLDQFQVTLSPSDPTRLVHIGNDVSAALKWTLQHLEPAPRYVGALAYQSEARHVALREPLEPKELLSLISSV